MKFPLEKVLERKARIAKIQAKIRKEKQEAEQRAYNERKEKLLAERELNSLEKEFVL